MVARWSHKNRYVPVAFRRLRSFPITSPERNRPEITGFRAFARAETPLMGASGLMRGCAKGTGGRRRTPSDTLSACRLWPMLPSAASTSRSKALADHAVDEIRFRADSWKQNGTSMPSRRDCCGDPKWGVLRRVHWGFPHQALSWSTVPANLLRSQGPIPGTSTTALPT